MHLQLLVQRTESLFSSILVYLLLLNDLFGFIKLFDSWSPNKFTVLTAYLLGYKNGIKLAFDCHFFRFSVFVAGT